MPSLRSKPARFRTAPSGPVGPRHRCRSLLVIDNRPLRNAAWAEFHQTRKRLENVSRDLHRHEQLDVPGYHSWLHQTFPVLISTIRELAEEVTLKSSEVERVQMMAALTGRSPRKLWRELKEHQARPPTDQAGSSDADDASGEHGWDTFDRDFANDEPPPDRARGKGERDDDRNRRDPFASLFEPVPYDQAESVAELEARTLYRRLVQHLHPDRGGEWTPARSRIWHEVQQAWDERDTDWLARLEIEWETANDTLSLESPISRVRRAIDELHAARRDAERKLRDYRRSFEWRFTLNEKKRLQLRVHVDAALQADLRQLQQRLRYLNATIAAWSEERGSKRSRPRARHRQ